MLKSELQHKIDFKTKPPGSLGELETIALKIGMIQRTLTPRLKEPQMLVFAADHGIALEGVSAFPQEVTHQMVFNFLNGGAAINVFARNSGMALSVVDAGVNFNFPATPGLRNEKVGMGTRSFLNGPAMTRSECVDAMERGAKLVGEIHSQGSNVVGFGEMGIANTSSAAMLMSLLGGIQLKDCVGSGTGLDGEGVTKKLNILEQALANNPVDPEDPYAVLHTFGGFEIAMMAGAMREAARLRMVVLVDGFIASAAFLAAFRIEPAIIEFAIFSHCSNERGHRRMLELFAAKPVLDLGLRLGEGTGAALAYPVVSAAVAFLNEMASFADAGVSNKGE